MAKPTYIFGWLWGGDGYQLYIQKRQKDTPAEDVPPGCSKCSYWPTNKVEKATRFKSIQACIDYLHQIRPQEAEAMLNQGRIQVYQDDSLTIRRVPVIARQPELFAPDQLQPQTKEETQVLTDEQKIKQAGFRLVRYIREEKRIQFSGEYGEMKSDWTDHLKSPFVTYAEAERELKQLLQDPQLIEIYPDSGHAASKCWGKLYKAGFEFYRSEGIIPGHGTCRIKIGSKNWSNWKKFDTPAECSSAWDELMKDKKALHG